MSEHHEIPVDLTARYLADQLTPEERERYEAYLCSNPEALAELEATARLKVGLARLQAAGELDSLLPLAKAGATTGAPRPWFANASYLAMAASMAALVVGVFLWRGSTDTALLYASLGELQQGTQQPLAVGEPITLMRMRSAGDDATIELPAAPQALAFRVLVDGATSGFNAELARMNAEDSTTVIARGAALSVDNNGFVAIYVDSSRVQAGRYQLTLIPLQSTDGSNAAQTFRIRVLSVAP